MSKLKFSGTCVVISINVRGLIWNEAGLCGQLLGTKLLALRADVNVVLAALVPKPVVRTYLEGVHTEKVFQLSFSLHVGSWCMLDLDAC